MPLPKPRGPAYQAKRLDPSLYFLAAKPTASGGYVFLNDGLPLASKRAAEALSTEIPQACEPLVLVGVRVNRNTIRKVARRTKPR
jgi:hypothetical protein